MAPRLSVLMAVHDGGAYLRDAVDSTLAQSFRDFEVIVVDDGSRDDTAEILRGYADPRLRVLRNPRNLGLTRSLNRAAAEARGELWARMDADDVNEPERFARQIAYLDAHPEIGVCATRIAVFGDRRARVPPSPTAPDAVAAELLFGNPIAHPSVMLRRDLFAPGEPIYDEGLERSQDYALWTRLATRTRIAMLGAALLRYRKHPGSVSHTQREQQRATRAAVAEGHLRRLGPGLDARALSLHRKYMCGEWDELGDPAAFAHWSRALLSLAAGTPSLQVGAVYRALCLRLAQVHRWPGPTRSLCAARLLADAGVTRVVSQGPVPSLGAGLASLWLPGPLWNYLRYR